MGLASTRRMYPPSAYASSDIGKTGKYHGGPVPDRGSREPRRLCSANSLCSESVPGLSSPLNPNKALGLGFPRVWSRSRVCSGGGDVELTKPDRFRPPPSIHENPESVIEGRTVDREGIARALSFFLSLFVRLAESRIELVPLTAFGPVVSALAGFIVRD